MSNVEIIPLENEVSVIPTSGAVSKLTEEEHKLASFLMTRGKDEQVSVYIPDDISDEDLNRYTRSCMKVMGSLESAQMYLYPIVARLMNIAEKRPEFLQQFGCNSINEFALYCKDNYGIVRSEVMYARKIVKLFPDITPSEFIKVGPTKLKAIGKAHNWEPDPKIYEYKKYAEDHDRNALLLHMQNDGVNVDALNMSNYTIYCSQDSWKKYRDFFDDPQVQAYCETKVPEHIMHRMIDECLSQWVAAEYFRERIENGD